MIEEKKNEFRNGGLVFKPWAGASIHEWANASQPLVITDMSACEPLSALSQRLRKGTWKVMPYVMTDGLTGKMVWAAQEAQAPELSLPLNAEGWFAIFVGLYSSSEFPTKAWLRLSQDAVAVSRINDFKNSRREYFASDISQYNCSHGNSEDVFFKVANLSMNSCLLISQQRSGITVKPCGVTHVTLIKLTQEEIDSHLADRMDQSHRTLAATDDDCCIAYFCGCRDTQEWLRTIEGMRNTDFDTLLLYSLEGGRVNYPSKDGHMPGAGRDLFPDPGLRYHAEAIREAARKGINPVKLLIEGAHEIDMKVQVGVHPAGWSFYEPYCDYWESPFFINNPQWRCIDRDGTPVTRMSWAVPEVRKHMIDLLREQVQFGADGCHIAFNRGCPIALYEPAAIELFKNRYEEDPRTMDESDPRIARWWSDILMTFMRELRGMLDQEQDRRNDGKRLEISLMVFGDESRNLEFGIDIRQLVEEGLVDELFPWGWEFPHVIEYRHKKHGFDLDFFRDVCGKNKIPFSPTIVQLENNRESWQSLSGVRRFIESGAKGIAVWDPNTLECDIYYWSVVSRFGHVEETLWREKNLDIFNPPRSYHEFHRLGEHIRDGRFGVQWGG